MPTLPEILHDENYKDTWELDGWQPKPKEEAPKQAVLAIHSRLKVIKQCEDEGIVS